VFREIHFHQMQIISWPKPRGAYDSFHFLCNTQTGVHKWGKGLNLVKVQFLCFEATRSIELQELFHNAFNGSETSIFLFMLKKWLIIRYVELQ
jgi:hypothetical protein